MALRKFYIVVGDPVGSNLVSGFDSDSPDAVPEFTRDDALDVELHFLERDPAGDSTRPFKYLDPSAWPSVVVAAGLAATPDSGTFTITDSVAAQTTAAIAFDASAATLQAAIRAALTMDFGSATVTGDAGGPWIIDRVTTGAFATNPTTTTAALSPAGSVGIFVNTEDGTASLSEKWQLSLVRAHAVVKSAAWSALASAAVTVTQTQAGGAGANKIYDVTWNTNAHAGAVWLAVTAVTGAAETVGPIAFDASEEDFETALEAHNVLVDGDVAVSKNGPGDYTVMFLGTQKQSNTPVIATALNSLEVPLGLSGRLACNTAVFTADLAAAENGVVSFEIEIQRSSGNRETVVLRDDAVFRADIIRNTPSSSSPTSTTLTVVETILVIAATAYTGGGVACLDGLATLNVLTTGQLVAFIHATDGLRIYQLTAGTTAESSPDVIRPDDYAASTNERVWLPRF